MTGQEFYNFLKENLASGDIISEKDNHFIKWLYDSDLQFSIQNNSPKSIPKAIIILARDAHNKGVKLTNEWLIVNKCNRGWCIVNVLNYLNNQADQIGLDLNMLPINQSFTFGQTSTSIVSGLNNIRRPKDNKKTENSKISFLFIFLSIFFVFGIYSYIITQYPDFYGSGFFQKSKITNDISGLFHDSFNNSIELQSNGKVHYYQITGKSMSCHTTGTWTKLDNNQLIISLEINSNCLFNKRYSGTWEIKDCYKLGEEESGCLVKGDEYYFYKVK